MSRLLSFETLHNTRDLGGMRAADGRRIKKGRLIRSARLSDISSHDQEILAGILDTVVDFRDVAERLEHPDTDLKGVTYIDLPLLDQLAAGVTRDVNSEQEMLSQTVDDPVKAIRIISGIYTSLVMNDFIVSQYGRFLRILLEQHDKAVLWHCSGGKDRAGIGAVLVEEILGVPREDIIADYMKTNDYLSESKETMIQHVTQKVPAGTKISCEALECLYYAKREYIDAFYHAVEQKYGDIRTFLQEGLQLTQEDIDSMREMYLEEASNCILKSNEEIIELDMESCRTDWSALDHEAKNRQLFFRQKKTLDTFLERGAISQAQYDKSLHDLTVKMGMEGEV